MRRSTLYLAHLLWRKFSRWECPQNGFYFPLLFAIVKKEKKSLTNLYVSHGIVLGCEKKWRSLLMTDAWRSWWLEASTSVNSFVYNGVKAPCIIQPARRTYRDNWFDFIAVLCVPTSTYSLPMQPQSWAPVEKLTKKKSFIVDFLALPRRNFSFCASLLLEMNRKRFRLIYF